MERVIVIGEKLVSKTEETYTKTERKVRVNWTESEIFDICQGVRQGCSLSPSPFPAFIEDIDEIFRKIHAGGGVWRQLTSW